MSTLTDKQLLDLSIGTLAKLGKLKFNQIAQKLQSYEVLPRIMKKDKIQIDSGKGIEDYVMVSDNGAAKNVGMYQKDEVNVTDVMKSVKLDWRHTTTNYAWDRKELAMNGGESKIIDIMKVRRAAGLLSLANRMEDDFWSKPTNTADVLPINGIEYWVVKNSTIGFNGGAPAGFPAGCGGLLHDHWKNYTGTYTNVSKEDLVKKLRTARRKTNFKSPIDLDDYRKGTGQQYRCYANETTINDLETLAEKQNENLGVDLAKMDGSVTIGKAPLLYVPKLDEDTTNPLYLLDWSWIFPYFLKGEYMHESEPAIVSGQHTTYVVYIDLSWNLMFKDRRSQTVIYKA